MIDYARRKLASASGLEWRQADATKLPFDDESFDAVVCQFGLMFFPDKIAGVREAFRVLERGGRFLFSVWDALERNAFARITHETLAAFFPSDPLQFYTVPFSLHDAAKLCGWLASVGFEDVESLALSKIGVSPSASDAATGLISGNPVYTVIMERRPDVLSEVTAAVARNLAAELGDHPLRCELRTHVLSARRPR